MVLLRTPLLVSLAMGDAAVGPGFSSRCDAAGVSINSISMGAAPDLGCAGAVGGGDG